MRKLPWILLLLSLGGLVALIHWQGTDRLTHLVTVAGWPLAAVLLLWIPQTALGAAAWRTLFEPSTRPSWGETFLATWIGTAVNTLAPVATIGGTVVKARVLVLGGVDATRVVASVIVDKTLQAVVVVVWAALGVALLVFIARPSAAGIGVDGVGGLAWLLGLLGLVALVGGIAIFIYLQVRGSLGPLARAVNRWVARSSDSPRLSALVSSAAALDTGLRQTYARPRSLLASAALRLTVRVVLLAEIVYAAALMGHPVGLVDALVLRALVAGLDAMLFMVPGGIGVQEAGFVGAGLLLGLPGDLALVLALVARARMVVPSVPGVLLWQLTETRRAFNPG